MNKKIWRVLFSIQIDDASKKKGDAWDVAVVPTPACIEKLKQYNLRFKKLHNGAVIIFENDGVRKPIKTIKAESFLFYLKPLNSVLESKLPVSRHIFNDNMPLTISGTGVFYFDNLDKNGKILRGSDISLTEEDSLTVADTALLVGTNTTILFKEDTKIVLDKRTIEVEAEKNLLIFEGKKDISTPLNFNKLIKDAETQVFVDLKDALYTLSWGAAAAKRVRLFKSDSLIFEKPLGLIEIFENNGLSLDKTTHYILTLKRSTEWRYMILHDKVLDITNINLDVGGSDLLQFDSSTLENEDNRLELNIIKGVEQRYDAHAVLYKSSRKLLIDRQTQLKALLKWKQGTKDYEKELATPTANSSEVLISFKIIDKIK
jgi:hypothetical protein